MNKAINDFAWLDALKWDANGLIPAIAQDAQSARVIMFAWMNRASLVKTLRTGKAVYWSRSRACLWEKGEESGHFQRIKSIHSDCDQDVLLLSVEQVGGIACHTGRESCFFHVLQEHQSADQDENKASDAELNTKLNADLATAHWLAVDPVLKAPQEIYKK